MTDTTAASTSLRTATVLLSLVGLLVLVTVPAGAHPFLRAQGDGVGIGEVRVDSLATITLDLAHGCGTEAAGDGEDTLEVALEVPEWLRIVEIIAHDGYEHEVEVTDGRVEVITWLDAGGAEPAPTFDLDVVADGEPGDTRYLPVFQGCADQSYRWIGTPDEPAEDPAVRVRLIESDPDSPPPPEEPFEDPDAEEEPLEEDAEDRDGPEDEEPAVEADPAPTDESDAPQDDLEATEDDTDALAAQEEDAGGVSPLLLALLAVAVLAVVAAAVRLRGRGRTPADQA